MVKKKVDKLKQNMLNWCLEKITGQKFYECKAVNFLVGAKGKCGDIDCSNMLSNIEGITCTVNGKKMNFKPGIGICAEYHSHYWHSGKDAIERDSRKHVQFSQVGIVCITWKDPIDGPDFKLENMPNYIYSQLKHLNILPDNPGVIDPIEFNLLCRSYLCGKLMPKVEGEETRLVKCHKCCLLYTSDAADE